jgi:integrase
VDAFLRATLARGRRAGTFRFYDEKLGGFSKWAADRTLDEISRGELKAWLQDSKYAPSTKRMIWRAVRAVFRWAAAQEPPLLASDPTKGLKLELPEAEHAIKFLSVGQAESIMRGIPKDMRAAVALQLFAGIRPEEVAPRDKNKPRLGWESVHFEEKTIRIEANVSKTKRARILEGLPDALWSWMRSDKKDTGPICSTSSLWILDACKTAGGFVGKKPAKWPHDAMRRSFATYAVALTGDPGKVSLWLGHEGSTSLLHRHYRGLVTKADAKAYFEILP